MWFLKKCSVSKLYPPKKTFWGRNYTPLPSSCLKNVPPPPSSWGGHNSMSFLRQIFFYLLFNLISCLSFFSFIVCIIFTLFKILKGQCHEDFAVLDQFWAKIITLRLYSVTKCFCKATTKISNEFYQRGLTIPNFLRVFWRRSIKIRKNCHFFQISIQFHPYCPKRQATGNSFSTFK